jgi:hypothetical protein
MRVGINHSQIPVGKIQQSPSPDCPFSFQHVVTHGSDQDAAVVSRYADLSRRLAEADIPKQHSDLVRGRG